MWWALKLQAIGLVAIFITFHLFEQRKAMRGADRKPVSRVAEISLRAVFLALLLGPSCWYVDSEWLPVPIMLPLLALYGVTFCDLSELTGSRATGGRDWRVWNLAKWYFSLRLVPTVELDPTKLYVLGVHPHSILPFGAIIAIGTGLHRICALDYRVIAATFVFYVPGYRDICLAGGIADASRQTAHRILSSGKSIALCPGGATEALYCSPDRDIVYLQKRRGFIKLAIEHGAALVPVFSFNECNTYRQFAVGHWLVDAIKSKFQRLTGLSLPLIRNIIPYPARITVVLGEPIPVTRNENPSDALVDEVLARYVSALAKLYAANAPLYNEPPTKPALEIL